MTVSAENQISIIVPVYNSQRYLSRCLDSLVNQTYGNIEILLINDGSTDNSLSIIREYAEEYPQIRFFTQENRGVGAARNIGLKNAIGEYIMFCDSDDTFEPSMCEDMLLTMQNEHVDMVMCNIYIHKKNGSYVAKVGSYEFAFKDGKYRLSPGIMDRINVFVWSKIFKKSIIDKFNIAFPNIKPGEDNSFMYHYLSVIDNVYMLNKPLCNHFEVEGSTMYNFKRGQIRISEMYQKIHLLELFHNFLNENNIFEKNRVYFSMTFKRQIKFAFLSLGEVWEKPFFKKAGELLEKIT